MRKFMKIKPFNLSLIQALWLHSKHKIFRAYDKVYDNDKYSQIPYLMYLRK